MILLGTTTVLLVLALLAPVPAAQPRRVAASPLPPTRTTPPTAGAPSSERRRRAPRRRMRGPRAVDPSRTLGGLIGARGRQRSIATSMPDAIEMLVLVVHAGASPTQAVDQVRSLAPEPIRPAFEAVVHRLHRGQRLGDAVGALPELLGHPAVGVADAIAAADRYGLPLGPVLDAMADEARAERRRLGEAHARTLSVKLSFPLVLCTLPAFVLVSIVPAVLGSLSALPSSSLRP